MENNQMGNLAEDPRVHHAWDKLDGAGRMLKLNYHMSLGHPVPVKWVEWLLSQTTSNSPSETHVASDMHQISGADLPKPDQQPSPSWDAAKGAHWRLRQWRDHGTGPDSYTAGSDGFAEDVKALMAENEKLRALVTRVTDAADNLASELTDPGTEALAATHCGRHFIYG